ncbi:MAG TPA: hypothetical protein VI584_08720 [Nitrospiria bacterium]|nr:hypothetical protein [Nitrospiria bacterium]
MKKNYIQRFSICILYGIILGLEILLITGCTTSSSRLRPLPADYAVGDKTESIIFGRLSTPAGTFALIDKFNKTQMLVRNESSGDEYIIISDKGSPGSYFFVALPPGVYTITKVKRGDGYSSPSFQFVAEPGHVDYLGTLKFELEEGQDEDIFERFLGGIGEALKKGLAGKNEEGRPEDWRRVYDSSDEMMAVRHSESIIKGDWQVEDEYDEAVKDFHRRYPHIDKEITKNLFRKKDGA